MYSACANGGIARMQTLSSILCFVGSFGRDFNVNALSVLGNTDGIHAESHVLYLKYIERETSR